MAMTAALDVSVAVTAVLLFLWLRGRRPSSSPPLPPGPKKIPILGNLFDMPAERQWLRFAAWGKKYGRDSCINLIAGR